VNKKNCILFLYLFISINIYSNYPEIKFLHKSDHFFSQMQYELDEYYRRSLSGLNSIPLSIYKYIYKSDDDIFSICSRLNITYDSIVSLNGIENPDEIESGTVLLIPNSPGVYICRTPEKKIEELISLREQSGLDIVVNRSSRLIKYTYLQGVFLNKNERSYFFRTLFKKPLDNCFITSDYGFRIHPISGNRSFHTGLDFRASIGDSVYSSRDGIISESGMLVNYGLYIIIKHEGGYETVYSHLDKINVKINDRILSGQIIGESGNSGISTGPHLHFEIRKNGIPLNPDDFFPGDI